MRDASKPSSADLGPAAATSAPPSPGYGAISGGPWQRTLTGRPPARLSCICRPNSRSPPARARQCTRASGRALRKTAGPYSGYGEQRGAGSLHLAEGGTRPPGELRVPPYAPNAAGPAFDCPRTRQQGSQE